MNLADVWDTPGYFYALGYAFTTAIMLWFEGESRHSWRKWISCAVLAAFLVPFSIRTKGTEGLLFALSMAAMAGAILLCVYVNLRDLSRTVFIGLKAFIHGEFASSLCWQIYYSLAIHHEQMQCWPWLNALMIAGFAIILTAFFFIERPLHRNGTELSFTPRDLGIESLIVITVYVVSNLGYIDKDSLFSGSRAQDIFAIRTLVDMCGVAMLYALQLQLIDVQNRLEKDALNNIMQMQYQAYQLTRESIEVVNQKYHDLKHQIALLKAQTDSEKAQTWLGQMETDIRAYEARHNTGNMVLDAVLTNKSIYCQHNAIELKYIADGSLLGFMDDMDLSALFGNMLDNAIESVERCAGADKRIVRLYVTRERGFLCIRIENYCEEHITFRDGIPVTTKRDKRYHGFGMKSMQRTVAKYGGSMRALLNNNWFELKILIPLDADD